MQCLRRLPALGAIGEHHFDGGRQQRWVILFGWTTGGAGFRNLSAEKRCKSFVHEREVFEHTRDGPAIRRRRNVTPVRRNAVDGFAQGCARPIEPRQYLLFSHTWIVRRRSHSTERFGAARTPRTR